MKYYNIFIIILLLILLLLISYLFNLEYFLNKKKKNVIMTTYFCKKKDPQRIKYASCNDINYIKVWYDSIKKLDLNGIIFHDGLDNEFIKKYKTDKINFIYINSSDYNLSLNDLRFLVYLEYLEKNKNIKNVFMTDGNDVTVKMNPFEKLDFKNIYAGSEKNPGLKWVNIKVEVYNKNNKLNFDRNKIKLLYNAGILGGNRENILIFLEKMKEKFLNIDDKYKNSNLNMIVFNDIIYNEINIDIKTGFPLHSVYKKYENKRDDVFFIHK